MGSSCGLLPDNTRIVSCSDSKTMRIRNTHTGNPIGKPLEGHPGNVLSAVFSPDSTHILSGPLDRTTRIWDVHAITSVGELPKGHTGTVWSMVSSSNSSHIIRGIYMQTCAFKV